MYSSEPNPDGKINMQRDSFASNEQYNEKQSAINLMECMPCQ